MVGMTSSDNVIKVFFISKAFKFLIITPPKIKRNKQTTKKSADYYQKKRKSSLRQSTGTSLM